LEDALEAFENEEELLARWESMRPRYRSERDKRTRKGPKAVYLAYDDVFPDYNVDPFVSTPRTQPLEDDVDVAILGAGISGLSVAARLRKAGLKRIRLIDIASDVGGVWYWNRYPGAQCDVESYIYLPLLEELGYVPTEKYAYQPEILAHLQAVAKHFDLYDDACFQAALTAVTWCEEDSRWLIETDKKDRFRSRFLIVTKGPLNRPRLPAVPGLESFAGRAFHTSRWDYDYTGGDANGTLSKLADKRVGIIGTGATAIQAVPHLGASAKSLYVFQRTPSAIFERNNRLTDPEWAASLRPGWQRHRMWNFNSVVEGGSVQEDLVSDGWTNAFTDLPGYLPRPDGEVDATSKFAELADLVKMERVRARVDSIIDNPEVADALKPYYRAFCKRPCFHDEYLDTFNRPNVHLVDTMGQGISEVVPSGVIVDGQLFELDCLVYSTGFEAGTSFTDQSGYDIVGRAGIRLSDKWADGFRTLHGLFSHGFPNCFFTGLTQTAIAVNYNLLAQEQSDHIGYVVEQVLASNEKTIEATQEAENDWCDTMDAKQSWSRQFWDECTPSRFNNEGALDAAHTRMASVYGGGAEEFFAILEEWRDEGSMRGLLSSNR